MAAGSAFVGVGSSPLTRGKPAGLHRGRRCPRAHPRSRGENLTGRQGLGKSWGSSPLTRGKQSPLHRLDSSSRLIPAHAGKTPSTATNDGRTWAHPRSRGENQEILFTSNSEKGSSPLTRGKLRQGSDRPHGVGLIPAHAGKTSFCLSLYLACWAHPRSRGENRDDHVCLWHQPGSSPLTRGKP